MTIGGWIIFCLLALIPIGIVIGGLVTCESTPGKILSVIIAVAIFFAILFGMLWYFNNTASGQRALVDEKSELNNGIQRTINVYTANGDLIAQYTGEIDIDTNDGGYVKFDFDGKRYIYYNCFVETIADIE